MPKLYLLFFLSLSFLPFISSSDDYKSFVYAGCSQTKYTPGSPYQLSVESLLTSLSKAAESSTYANFTSSSAEPAYGLFQCRADLPISNCDSCIHSALSQLSALCPGATGAAVQLRSCFLRYDKESFLGKPDDTLLYKRCGGAAAGGYASDVFGLRDAALGSLTAAPPTGGSYRVGGAGYVQAMAQCVGDLSPKECTDCVESAVAQVKAVCGFAVGADVYLGKCYLQYWSNGVYPSRHNHVDETGKTLAIIIGILAAVALILVFLSFIRRAGGKY
ncbi:plasmodesmata-located protein 7-like isoform X2 [Phoenix dactylifera]|uniref:Plasmodesmata-located protein 7-like isoform X2 n=1 Tax=Phoenix dactylifera TaxID=42345 RepID=A0A8B8ZZ16_PHODC|nr:plasmodesmata-located protein 7-like isoform X2 [Phoenix dactylifera]